MRARVSTSMIRARAFVCIYMHVYSVYVFHVSFEMN